MKAFLATLTILAGLSAFAQENWTDRALQNAQSDFTGDEQVEFFNLAGQNLGLFGVVKDTINSFAQTQNLQIDQAFRTQKLTPADQGAFKITNILRQCSQAQEARQTLTDYENFNDVLAKPFLLYAEAPWAQPDSSTFDNFDGLLTTMLGVLAKVNFPEPYESHDVLKIRVENAIRKIHIQKLLPYAQQVLMAKQILLKAANDGCLSLSNPEQAKLSLASSEKTFQLFSLLQKQIDQTKSKISVHPELNHQDRRALSAFLGGYLWRFRGAGGFDNMGTSDRRSVFVSAGFEAIMKLNGAGLSASAVATALKFGVQTTSWGRYHDMGRLNDDKYSDYLQMEKLGRAMTSDTKQVLNMSGYRRTELITIAGASLGSCYFTAWETISPALQVGAQAQNPYLFIFGGPTNFGELCEGTSLGLALSLIGLNSL